jgi:predicted glycosyltransferase
MAGPDIHALRSGLLLEAARSFRPDVLVVDKHPLGAGGELRRALEAVRAAGGRTVLGLRDILDDPETVRREWQRQRLAERIVDYYDQVLVYGSAAVFDTVREYGLPDAVAERTRYCGYVVHGFDCAWRSHECPYTLVHDERRHPVVLGTTGGGEDGYQILKSFVHAAGAEAWNSVAVAGPLLSAPGLHSLQRLAAEQKVTMHTFIPCLSNLFRNADALVCMGGYNTLSEAAAFGVPAVCVPRIHPRTEQLIRSQAFERLGLVRTLRPGDLSPGALRREVNAALATPRNEMLQRARASLHFDGAKQAAELLIALAGVSPQFRN